MRCPDCAKMVSYDEPQVEVNDESIDSEGNVSVEVRLTLPCVECGTELKDTTFNLEQSIDHECALTEILCSCGHHNETHLQGGGCTFDGCPCKKFEENVAEDSREFEMNLEEPEATEDFKPHAKVNKKGESVPVPMRYQKHFYGVVISGIATCNRCGEEIEFELADETQASYMDECC